VRAAFVARFAPRDDTENRARALAREKRSLPSHRRLL
jgi:hypothetical protein